MTVPAASSVPIEHAQVIFDGGNWTAQILDEFGGAQYRSRPCATLGAAVAELQVATGKIIVLPLELAP
jgi:hypothetical protein